MAAGRVAVAFALSMGALAACNAVLGIHQLEGSGDEAGPNSGAESGASDGSAFADSRADNGETGNGGSDAGADGTAGGRWCDKQTGNPIFCQDFDNVPSVTANWQSAHTSIDGSTLTLDPLALSAPSSMRAFMVDPKADCTLGGAYQDTDFNTTGVHVQFAVRIGDVAGTSGFPGTDISEIDIGDANVRCGLFFASPFGGPGNIQIQRYDPALTIQNLPLSGGVKKGDWSIVDEYVSPAPDGGLAQIRVVVDGQEVLPETTMNCPIQGTIGLSLGLYGCYGTNEARYDNVKAYRFP